MSGLMVQQLKYTSAAIDNFLQDLFHSLLRCQVAINFHMSSLFTPATCRQ